MRHILTLAAVLAGLLGLTAAASAYDCDALIARMRQALPTIAPEENNAEGVRAVTLIGHDEQPGSEQVTLECSSRAPQLVIQWNGTKPPEDFWDMVGKLGGIASEADPSVLREVAKNSCARAFPSYGSPDRTPTGFTLALVEGVHLDCSAWRAGGGANVVTLYRVR
jgi:hypothetical protein